jgi:2-polyprenyl-6-methoxyphenol hydroxylase-like FAD-dependent oxidoreductase
MSQFGKAIIIGGSIGGLTSARILAGYFQEVTIVDRDVFPDVPESRSGVPQAKQGHVMLARGQKILEELFPGNNDDLIAHGAEWFDWSTQYLTLMQSGWVHQLPPKRFMTIAASRVLIEHLLRKRVEALPNVTFLTRTEARAIIPSDDKKRVIGLTVFSREKHTETRLYADLIIDCSGRNSSASDWLRAMGYETPAETKINSYIGYATRWYRVPEDMRWKFIGVQTRPDQGILRGGGFLGVENGLGTFVLQGVNRDYPPTDEAEFQKYSETFASPILHDLMSVSEPVSGVMNFRYDGSRMLHFEKLERFPERLLILGDAVCSFNPIYGQGMTTAALQAEVLGKLMKNAKTLDGLSDVFRKQVAQVLKVPWMLASAEDLRFPDTEGERPDWFTRQAQKFANMIITVLPYDSEVALRFNEVAHMLKPMTALMSPGFVGRVLRHRFFGKKADIQQAPQWSHIRPLEQAHPLESAAD